MLERLVARLAATHAVLLVVLLSGLAATGRLDGTAAVVAVVSVGAAALLGGAILAAWLRPLRGLAQAAQAIARGALGQRVHGRPVSELRELAGAFNEMAESVEALISRASQERNRLVAALNSSTDAVLAVDPEGRITFANASAERLFGRTQAELAGQPFGWVMPDEEVLEAVRASREEGRREARLIERPPRQYLEVITTPIVGGGDWAALVVCHDLSDVKRVEQVRRDFIANVSHELRTPLASIKAVVETLQGGALHGAAADAFLSQADAEVDRLVEMVEELLELSRIESGDVPLARQRVQMEAVLGRAVERLQPQAAKRGVQLRLNVAPVLPPVTGDAERLERVAVNLVQNALNFTAAGGSVTVSACPAGDALTVAVSDTGTGIDPKDLPRVFERFYKADRARTAAGARLAGGGTGLGLAIVKHTVEAHGGSVTVESEPGRSTTFSFSLPAASR